MRSHWLILDTLHTLSAADTFEGDREIDMNTQKSEVARKRILQLDHEKEGRYPVDRVIEANKKEVDKAKTIME